MPAQRKYPQELRDRALWLVKRIGWFRARGSPRSGLDARTFI